MTLIPQHPPPALGWNMFFSNSFGDQSCVYAVWLRPPFVVDLVFVLVVRAQCPAVVQTVCDCSNLVIKTAKIMTNATDKNIFGARLHQPLDHWPLLVLENLNQAKNNQSIGWEDIYQWASHEELSPFPGVMLCRTVTLWPYFCQRPFLSLFIISLSLRYTLLPFHVEYVLNYFFLDKLVCIFLPR